MTFDEFLTAELRGLTRFAAVLTGDRHLAEDLVQDALVKAHGRWQHIGGMDGPEKYVRRMVVNGYLSWRRRWATRTIHAAGDLAQHERTAGGPGDPAHSVAQADHVRRLVATLPRRQRAAVVLRFYVGCDDGEAARAMGCSVQTVRSHISRALAAMRLDPSVQESDEPKGATL